MAEVDFYILPYYFDDDGVLKSRVKVGDYITIESGGKSSQKQVRGMEIETKGKQRIVPSTWLKRPNVEASSLVYSIITNDNIAYRKTIISEGEYRGEVCDNIIRSPPGRRPVAPRYIDFEFKIINPTHLRLAFAKGLNERLNEYSPLLELPVDLFERIVNLLPGGAPDQDGGGRKKTKKKRKSKKRKSKRNKSKKKSKKRKSKKR
jgi:hypothetical protein